MKPMSSIWGSDEGDGCGRGQQGDDRRCGAGKSFTDYDSRRGCSGAGLRCGRGAGTRSAEDGARAKETVNYFAMVADRSRLPVVLVSEHGRRLSVEIVARLAEHPNVIGVITAGLADETEQIKIATASVKRNVTVTTVFAAATGRMLRVAETASGANLGGVAVLSARPAVRTRTKQVGFQVLTGSTTGMLEAWKAGASGAVPRLSVCAPQACCEVWQAYRDGDPALAEEKQERLRQAAAYLKADAEGDLAALKYGCDFNGYFGGRPRLPVLPILDDERVQVERVLAGMRN